MTDLRFVSSATALLRGTDTLLAVAPAARFDALAGPLPDALAGPLPDDLAETVRALAVGVSPGANGAVDATARPGDKPARVAVGVLPDEVSRHNSPARAEAIRNVVAKGARRGKTTAVVLFLDDVAHALPAVNAVGRATSIYSAKSGQRKRGEVRVLAVGPDGKVVRLTKAVTEVAAASRRAAELVDTPPTEMHPGAFAKAARALLRNVPNVTLKEIRGEALLREKLAGIHAVGRTAVEAPRMLVASYRPPRAGKAHIALVGKGVTYDTGGLHLKPRGGMEGMKADMGGAAAVLGAFRAIAASGMKRRVTMIVCLAENAIGPAAYKPDDILTMHSGLTVEINNTDAEGRILLADGVSYAARKLKADIVIDAATLTGAQLVATGLLHAAVVSNDGELENHAIEAGRASGDLTHPLPFAPEFYRKEFESPVADMRNSVKNRGNAQSSCAGEFIHWHLSSTPARWCHVDLAGPAFPRERGTGYGVALLHELVSRLGG